MKEGFCERTTDRLMLYGPLLPVELTADSDKRWVRIFGLLWYVIWVIPAMVIVGIPVLLLLLGSIFKEAWKGMPLWNEGGTTKFRHYGKIKK